MLNQPFYTAISKQKKEYNRQLPCQIVLWKFLSSGNVGFNLFKDVLQLARKMLLIAYVRSTASVLEALADVLVEDGIKQSTVIL